MNKDDLIESANNFAHFSDQGYSDYEKWMPSMIVKINEFMLSRPDIVELVGEKNFEMMKDNHANHAHFIASILKNYNPVVLVETILWVFRAYRSRGFHSNYWAAQLNSWKTIIIQTLPEESANEILQLYNWMQINIPVFTKLSDEKLDLLNSKNISH